MTNRKLRTRFPFVPVPKSMTLGDLERRLCTPFPKHASFEAYDYKENLNEGRPTVSAAKM